LHERHLNLSDS